MVGLHGNQTYAGAVRASGLVVGQDGGGRRYTGWDSALRMSGHRLPDADDPLVQGRGRHHQQPTIPGIYARFRSISSFHGVFSDV